MEPEVGVSVFFMVFSLMIMARKSWIHPLSTRAKFQKERSRLERNLASRKGNLVTKNARSGMKEFVSGM